MKYKDFNNNVFPSSGAVIYNRVSESKDVCVHFDSSSPVHCAETLSCHGTEPLLIMPRRLTRDPSIMIKYRGWIDPFPHNSDQASGIKSFAITVHEVKELDKLTLIMDEKGQSYNASNDEANITLPHEPALYGIALEVLDNAGNVKSARRFVMFDKSSEIKINFLKYLKVDSASPETNYIWQTHRKRSCLSWDDRYYNSYNYRFNLLRKIQKDFHGGFI